MLDRGLRAALPARRRAAPPRTAPAARRPRAATSRDLPTFTIDPVTARDFDDAISGERLGDDAWRVWVHIADVSAYVRPGSRDRPRGLPARHARLRARARSSRCCPRRSPTTPARCVPGEERLAVTVELELRRRRDGQGRRSTARSIRSDERLDYDRVDRIFAGEERRGGPVGAAARRRARRPRPRCSAAARSGARAGDRVRRARVPLRPPRARHRVGGDRADRVPPADRAPDDRRQRAGRPAAGRARRPGAATACTSGPTPARAERLVAQLASLDVATPPVPEHDVAVGGRRRHRRVLAAGRPARAAHRPRARRR